jgi:hypothetical protein
MKNIIGYEGKYSACETGQIFSHKNGIYLKPRRLKNGYLRVALVSFTGQTQDFLIHRLICAAYHGQSSLHVNHKDCDKENNRPENLEWVSRGKNMQHAYLNGRLASQVEATIKRNIEKCSVPVTRISLLDGSSIHYSSMTAAETDGFSHAHISACVRGKRKTHGGFLWEVL